MTVFNYTDNDVYCAEHRLRDSIAAAARRVLAKYPDASCQVDLHVAGGRRLVLGAYAGRITVYEPQARDDLRLHVPVADVDERYLIAVTSGICDLILQLSNAFKIAAYSKLTRDLDNLIAEFTGEV